MENVRGSDLIDSVREKKYIYIQPDFTGIT